MVDANQDNIKREEKGDATGGIIPYKNLPALLAYYLGLFAVIPFLGIVLGITAFVLGIIGLRLKKKNPVIKGTVHAWIGIICGFLFGTFWLLTVILMIIIPK
ncbi:MAG: hypothetical protein JSW40_02400 [Candidatus Omnitrophota bacterium]|nr:MAG: hypothetical protein JSW40_02400 [Candidatus Omnitrophota bacterium]